MLKIFRKEGVQKKILWGLAGVIIISFVFFGTISTRLGISTPHAGKVYGKTISLTDFQKHFANTRDQAILIHGENFFKMGSFLNLEGQTWDRIILLEEAKKRRISVQNSEVIEFLKSMKMFQRDDQFDNLLYNDLLKFIFRRNPRDFEEGIRDQIAVTKLFEQVTSSLSINEKEIREAFRKDNEKIQISYLLIEPTQLTAGLTATEEEAKSYFAANPNEFMTPASINVEYLSLEFPKEAKEEEKNSVKDKVYEITTKIQSGDRLATIAQSYNLPIKESGFFNMNQPNMALGWSYDTLEKLFNLKPGDVSDPIETPNGYQFLSLKERREPTSPEFESVKTKVLDAVKLNKALALANQKAEESLVKIKQALSASSEVTFKSAVESIGLKTQQTPVFNRGQYLPVIGLSREFQDAAYDLTEANKLSPVIATAKGFCILYRDNVFPVEESEFQKEKDKYANAVLNEKRNQMIIDFMTEARLRADLQNNLPKLNNR